MDPDITHIAVSKTLKKTIVIDLSDDSSISSDEELPKLTPGATPLQEIFHTALQFPADLKDSPGLDTSWRGIDMEHVLDVIPSSLHLFLRVLFGGENSLELEVQDNSLKVKICIIAQDVVYTASKSRKLTPKHVGLGLAFHQATRSEQMVLNIFHAAVHTVGIDTVGIDDILRRYEQNGYIYIPNGISPYTPGRIIGPPFII